MDTRNRETRHALSQVMLEQATKPYAVTEQDVPKLVLSAAEGN